MKGGINFSIFGFILVIISIIFIFFGIYDSISPRNILFQNTYLSPLFFYVIFILILFFAIALSIIGIIKSEKNKFAVIGLGFNAFFILFFFIDILVFTFVKSVYVNIFISYNPLIWSLFLPFNILALIFLIIGIIKSERKFPVVVGLIASILVMLFELFLYGFSHGGVM